jgi:hypothetical protein
MDTPTLLAFNSSDNFYSIQLLEKLKPILPNKMNVHLSPHLIDVFGKENRIVYYGFNIKMQLTQKVSAQISICRYPEADPAQK